jgi:pyruvate ferredoxin oxidoreductase gamma subunit
MFQIRIHGRGGQGVVTAAEMLSVAAFREGRFAQAFPSFGSERTGAPVVASAGSTTRRSGCASRSCSPTR